MYIELRSVEEDGFPEAEIVNKTPWRICFVHNNRVYSGYPDEFGDWYTDTYMSGTKMFSLVAARSEVKYWFLLPEAMPDLLTKQSSWREPGIQMKESTEAANRHEETLRLEALKLTGGGTGMPTTVISVAETYSHWIKTGKRDWEPGNG